MKRAWKIFIVFNILQIGVFIGLLFLEFYRSGISFNLINYPLWSLFIIALFLLVVLLNCIRNIYCFRKMLLYEIFFMGNKIAFWLLSSLFLCVIVFLTLGLPNEYNDLSKPYVVRIHYYYALITFVMQLFVVLNGFYIFLSQLVSHFRFGRIVKKEIEKKMQEIGS